LATYVANCLCSLTLTRLLRDAELFKTKLSKLEGAGEVGTLLVNIVQEKSVTQTPVKTVTEASLEKEDQAAKKPQENVPADDTSPPKGAAQDTTVQ
jgi:vacuolar protein sorting-associated protein 54